MQIRSQLFLLDSNEIKLRASYYFCVKVLDKFPCFVLYYQQIACTRTYPIILHFTCFFKKWKERKYKTIHC